MNMEACHPLCLPRGGFVLRLSEAQPYLDAPLRALQVK